MFTPKELVFLIVLLVALAIIGIFFTGCSTAPKTVVQPSLTIPPMPQGVQTARTSAAPAFVAPAPTAMRTLNFTGAAGTNHMFGYYFVLGTSNLVNWDVITNCYVPADTQAGAIISTFPQGPYWAWKVRAGL